MHNSLNVMRTKASKILSQPCGLACGVYQWKNLWLCVSGTAQNVLARWIKEWLICVYALLPPPLPLLSPCIHQLNKPYSASTVELPAAPAGVQIVSSILDSLSQSQPKLLKKWNIASKGKWVLVKWVDKAQMLHDTGVALLVSMYTSKTLIDLSACFCVWFDVLRV